MPELKRKRFIFNSLTFILVLICLSLFLLLMNDVWNKFSNKLTSTGITYKANDALRLPCFTIHPLHSYKSQGFFRTNRDYEENTFQLEDIFQIETLESLKNKTEFKVKEIRTLIFGKCYMICSQNLRSAQMQGELFYLKTDFNFTIHFHEENEFLLMTFPSGVPYDIPTVTIDAHNRDGIVLTNIMVKEIKVSLIPNKSNRCFTNQYSDGSINFIECSRKNFWSMLTKKISCTIPGMESFYENSSKLLRECESKTEAAKAYELFHSTSGTFIENPSEYGCPLPCERKTVEFSLKYIHKTAMGETYDERRGFIFGYYFSTLLTEERVETLFYDFENFLVSMGGNLGLFLGFSVLSLGMEILRILKEIV
jgi:hypothetical protein